MKSWNLTLKNKKPDGRYAVSIRCYDGEKEQYMDTKYRVTREDWEAESGRIFRDMEDLRASLTAKMEETLRMITSAGQDDSLDLFRAVWNGKRLATERSWISLMDKHLEMKNYEYTLGTKRVYNDTRNLLKKIEAAGHDLSLGNFQTVEDYKRLEHWFTSVGDIGKTALAIHMQNIKAIANTGYDHKKKLKWITSDAFKEYRKPNRVRGTHPNDIEDVKAIKNFDVTTLSDNKKHIAAYKFGRDFWCWMVECGGMEARSIAGLLWKNMHLNKGHFTFEREKVEGSGGVTIWMSADNNMTRYMIETYGTSYSPNGYVFPFLQVGMSDSEKEAAITALAKKITKNVQKIARHLGISPLPSCKRSRPTFAVLSKEMGFDITKRQQMMGHKTIGTTEIYETHLPTKSKIAASSDFAKKLWSA